MGNDSKIKRMRREMRLVLREEALKALQAQNKRIYTDWVKTGRRAKTFIILLSCALIAAVMLCAFIFWGKV